MIKLRIKIFSSAEKIKKRCGFVFKGCEEHSNGYFIEIDTFPEGQVYYLNNKLTDIINKTDDYQ